MNRIIIIFQKELRIHDNRLLNFCMKRKEDFEIIPVMCFIPENFEYIEDNWYTHVKIDICCDIRKQFYL
jgi:deoxyribodipyrimidine photolyase